MQKILKPTGPKKLNKHRNLAIWIPVVFLVFVFLTGGGSRSDVNSLPLLRFASVLFACWAISGMDRADWRRIRVPFALLLALTLWIAVQLAPLPPAVWHALPGRAIIVGIDHALGQADLWRPISLTPSESWNSLLAMTVPFAALLVGTRLAVDDYRRIMLAIVIVACVSALLGFVQLLSGSGSAAYLYRITNTGSLVGFFANRNHHAIFLACAVIVAAMLLRDERMRRRQNKPVQGALIFAALLLTITTALIGSRAGLVAGVVAFAIGYAMVVASWGGRAEQGKGAAALTSRGGIRTILLYSPPILLAMLLGVALWLSSRITGLSRLAGQGVADDLRVQAWPVVKSMIENYWVAGTGFGSFSAVYKIFEPDNLLQPAYFNHAHNDWAELIITGGLPFMLIVLTALLWFGRTLAALGLRNLVKGHRGDCRLPVLVVIIVLSAASLVDYPLRVPSLQMLAILLMILLCCPKPSRPLRD